MDEAKRYVCVKRWMERNEDRILRASGLTNPEAPGASEKGQRFAEMMIAAVEKHFDSEFSIANLNSAFDLLVSRGLLSDPTPPPPPPPVQRKFWLELHPTGGETKTRGPFSAQEIIGKAQYYAREQTAVVIRNEQGDALDMDLEPLRDNPLGQSQTVQPQQPQQAQATAGTQAEYLRFFQTSRTDAIKARMRTEPGFRAWVASSGQLDFVQASSGGMSADGATPVEPRRL